MKKTVFLGAIVAVLASAAASSIVAAADFKVCKSTYALCTTAKCTAEPGSTEIATCACEVRTGFSAGQQPCEAEKKTSKGTVIASRYFPIRSYARCANNRPWAWCLDKPCVVDKDDPTKANCTCSVVEDQGDYVMVTDTYTAETCTIGLYSSATLTQLDEITKFIKAQGSLPYFPLKVLNADESTFGSMTPSSGREPD
jgi:hypothetical protein